MKELNLIQGSPEWLAARTKYFTASEANPMMGESKYQSRSSLLKQKATGITEDVDAATKARFDNGHATEAACRPLAEEVIGAELYPVVAIDDSEKFLASSDGVASKDGAITWLPIGWEHKALNASLAELVKAGIVPDSHKWQLVHQCTVFGFEKILFSVSDGTRENHHYCWFVPTAEDFARLEAGWDQFALDLANYQHVAEKPAVVAEKIEGLPALFVQVEGRVVASNMDAFKDAAELFLSRLPKADQLKTDQDFVNADLAAKDCKDAEEKLQIVKAQAQSQAVSIDEVFRAIDGISEKIRAARLSLEKVVKVEKENRKAEIVTAANREFAEHLAALINRVGVAIPVTGGFGEAVKGLKSLDSMRDKVSVALANAKIEANAIADRIEANRKTVEDMSIVPDFAQVCTKAPDDFAALLALRKQQRQEAEAERKAVVPDLQSVNDAITREFSALDAKQDAGPTIKLGEICIRLGFTVTADFLASLGVSPVATEKNAKLYPAAKFPSICRLISDHVLALAFKKAA